MTQDLDKQHRIERHKTLRAGLWVAAILLIMIAGAFIWRTITAPARAVTDTTEKVTDTATSVLTRRHIKVDQGRRFARLSDAAFETLSNLPESEPADMGERAFRAANLKGSQDKVCQMSMEFGAGAVTVWAAADNDQFATNDAMGGVSEKQIRLIFVTDAETLGITAETNEGEWALLWRRREALAKPLDDATIAARSLDALKHIPEECSPSGR